MVYVSSAPAKRSDGDFLPFTTGKASIDSHTAEYMSSASRAQVSAHTAEEWAVCASCQRNSALRRNGRVRSSHRTTLAHWLIFSGKSKKKYIRYIGYIGCIGCIE